MSTPPAEHVVTSGEVPCCCKLECANKIVTKYSYWAAGVGVIPIPLLDIAGVAGIQVKMLSELSNVYGVKFSEHRAKHIIGVLVSSVGASTAFTGIVASAIKIVPVVGWFSANVAFTAVAWSATYALGKVFISHFESGGTLLDFDPVKTKAYFAEQYKEGQKLAADAKQEPREAAPAAA